VPDADWIGMVREDDGDRMGRLSGGLNQGRGIREDNVDRQADQLGCEGGQLIDSIRPTEFDDDILALDPAKVT
jgi:hypothetical protein